MSGHTCARSFVPLIELTTSLCNGPLTPWRDLTVLPDTGRRASLVSPRSALCPPPLTRLELTLDREELESRVAFEADSVSRKRQHSCQRQSSK